MKYLIVGLGNIGAEYAGTRHNIGFDVVDAMAAGAEVAWSSARYGAVAQLKIKGRSVLLLKPSTYMNLSGKALNYWMQSEKIPLEQVLVIVDDMALPLGALRLRGKGSDGGHNGLLHIAQTLGHHQYARLRFGIGNDFPKGFQVDFVLGSWSAEEREALKEPIVKACEAVQSFVLQGLARTMNMYNTK